MYCYVAIFCYIIIAMGENTFLCMNHKVAYKFICGVRACLFIYGKSYQIRYGCVCMWGGCCPNAVTGSGLPGPPSFGTAMTYIMKGSHTAWGAGVSGYSTVLDAMRCVGLSPSSSLFH